jgi:hypothetical protein
MNLSANGIVITQTIPWRFIMSKARDLATLAGSATVLATDSEVAAAVAPLASTSYVTAAVAAVDLTPLVIADVMDSL